MNELLARNYSVTFVLHFSPTYHDLCISFYQNISFRYVPVFNTVVRYIRLKVCLNYAWISAGFPRQLVLILVALYDVHDGAQLIKLDGQRPVFR